MKAIGNHEIGSSFMALRNEMPMNCRARRKVAVSAQAQKDIDRIDAIWSDRLSHAADQGPWLFGQFSIADCMFAPVVLRFKTYSVPISASSQRCMQTMLTNERLLAWVNGGKKESEILPEDEAGEDVNP